MIMHLLLIECDNTKLLTGTVITCTTMTAMPNPIAVDIFLETARNVHIPRKNANAKFSTKTALINKANIFIH